MLHNVLSHSSRPSLIVLQEEHGPGDYFVCFFKLFSRVGGRRCRKNQWENTSVRSVIRLGLWPVSEGQGKVMNGKSMAKG